ncbi:MAG: hypothetical protein ACLR70_06645 [Streptococcus thermophilus]
MELQEIVALMPSSSWDANVRVVITGPDNMDEAALYGTNTYTLWKMAQISQHTFTYEDLGDGQG